MPVNDNKDERKRMPWILLLTIGLIVFNLYGLYMRYLILNLVGTIAILCVLYILLQVEEKTPVAGINSSEQNLSDIIRLAFETKRGIRKILLRTDYYFLASGTCLYGDDCIFYYVRHLFLVPIQPVHWEYCRGRIR